MHSTEEYEEQWTEHGIKLTTLEGIRRYVDSHVPPGDFLMAVLRNDLREAFGRADEDNRQSMFNIVKYCYNNIPSGCWGSPQRVEDWLNSK